MTDIGAVVIRRLVALLIALQAFPAIPIVLVGTAQPAAAQQSDWGFFSPFNAPPRRRPQAPTEWNQQQFWWGPQQQPQYEPRREREREREVVDYSKAPPPRKQEAAPGKHIVVMGDAMADWLAYGLEDAFSDTPEMGIVRKHRSNTGLIHGESRSAYDWPQAARDILASDQPAFIVMMIGMADRQSIRERPARANPVATPPNANPAATAPNANPTTTSPNPAATPPNPTATPEHPDQSASHPTTDEEGQPTPEEPATPVPEPGHGKAVTYEFRSEQWAAAYAKRIDEMIAVLKSRGVPVFWVGLPSMRGSHASADAAYLNDLYRDRAGKAGITYVDVWDGFVDENGNFSMQGPDFEGQVRRLRSADGVYFTKAGAQKLAHYAEREIRHAMTSQGAPVATPAAPEEPQTQVGTAEPGARAARPAAGPVVPLTGLPPASDGLLGGSAARSAATDSSATKFLVRGEPIRPAVGRADDFAWPRNQGLPQSNDDDDKRSDVAPAQKIDAKPADKPGGKPAEKPEGKATEKSEGKPAEKPEAKPVEKPENKAGGKADIQGPAKPEPPAPTGARSTKRTSQTRTHRPTPAVEAQPLSPAPTAEQSAPVAEQSARPSGPTGGDDLRPPGSIPGR